MKKAKSAPRSKPTGAAPRATAKRAARAPPAARPAIKSRPKKRARGRPVFIATDEQRRMVRALGIVGADQPTIGLVLAISPKTLRKHFRRELELAVIEATATVAAKLYSLAQRGDVAACIFWMKTHGWSERIAIDLAADRDVQEMSDAEIEARIARLSRRPGAKVVRLVPPSVA